MNEHVAAALRDGFPDRDVERTVTAGPSWNAANRTVGVEFADGERVFLKVATDGAGTRVARERAVVEYVDETDAVAAPTVVAVDSEAAVPYLATAPVDSPGMLERWRDADATERAALARQVGRALVRLHGERFAAHGHVTGGGADGLHLETGPWTDVLVDTIEAMRSLAPDDRFDHHFDAVVQAAERNRDLLDDAPAALLHGDPAQPNCFVQDDVGFLDWEIAHVGDPARDLYRARDQQFGSLRGDAPDHLVSALYDGYREHAGGLPDGFESRVPVYDAVRLLGVSGYFEKTVEFHDEEPEAFAAWLEAEMDRRLARL